jgi:hypothetical protein
MQGIYREIVALTPINADAPLLFFASACCRVRTPLFFADGRIGDLSRSNQVSVTIFPKGLDYKR